MRAWNFGWAFNLRARNGLARFMNLRPCIAIQNSFFKILLKSEEGFEGVPSSKRAVSTVLATIIIVSVAIVWVAAVYVPIRDTLPLNMAPTLELKKVACTTDSYDNWVISITLKNPSDHWVPLYWMNVNATGAMLDSKPPNEAVATITSDLNKGGRVPAHEEATISLWIGARAIDAYTNVTFSSGPIVKIIISSLAGKWFTVMMELDSGTGFIEQSGFRNNISGAQRPRMIFYGTLLVIFLGLCVRAGGRLRAHSEARSLKQRSHDLESPTAIWYLAALFFGIIGGLIGYVAVRDKDKGRNLLVIGVITSAIVWFVIVMYYTGNQASYYW